VQTPEYQTVSIRGQALRLLRAGKGAPLLWLRGTDASDGWRGYMDALAGRFDLIAPEHPGFGGAAKPDWLDDIGDMANFYFDMIAEMGFTSVHLAGHGLGGWIAAEMAIRDQRELASLTLVDAAGLLVDGAGGLDPFLRSEEEAILDQFFEADLGAREADRLLTPESEDVRIANQMVIAQLAWSPRWHDPHLRKWLHRIDMPTLVIWGEQDRVIPVAHAHVWAGAIPGARLEVVPSCGHAPHIERSALCADLIARHALMEDIAS